MYNDTEKDYKKKKSLNQNHDSYLYNFGCLFNEHIEIKVDNGISSLVMLLLLP